jgi:hypothetical protein
MKVQGIAIATLLTLTTVAGLQPEANAASRLEHLNQQSSAQVQDSQISTIDLGQIEQSAIPQTGRTTPQTQPETSLQDDQIDIKTIRPEYCRSFLPRQFGTVSRFEYFQGLDRCKYGN